MSEAESSTPPISQPEPKPSISKLATAYAKAQGSFRTPQLNRTAEVKKEGRLLYTTHYADLQEIIDCVRKALMENGLSFFQLTEFKEKNWYLVLELLHESGESKRTELPLSIVGQTNQQVGGTLTYLKRYQLSAFFGLAADFDDDGNATEGNEVNFTDKKTSQAKAKPAASSSSTRATPQPKPKDAPPVHPPDEPQQFPPDDTEKPSARKKVEDPGEYVVTIGDTATLNKRIDKIGEGVLVKLYMWTEGQMKAAPPPPNIGTIMETNRKIKEFLKSVDRWPIQQPKGKA